MSTFELETLLHDLSLSDSDLALLRRIVARELAARGVKDL